MSAAAKVGAPSVSSTNPMSPAQSKSSSKSGSKFDIIVVPRAPCKLIFQAYKRSVEIGRPVNEGNDRLMESKPITKISKLQVTLPTDADSYSIVFLTNNARNTSLYTFSRTLGFNSFGVEVSESTYQGNTKNNTCLFEPKVLKLPVLDEQSITFPEDDYYSASAAAPAEDRADEKGKK